MKEIKNGVITAFTSYIIIKTELGNYKLIPICLYPTAVLE
jgi:hypothetical protein